ncbi:MAG: outer membrane beta-barrel protein [Stenotrophobium sp.]
MRAVFSTVFLSALTLVSATAYAQATGQLPSYSDIPTATPAGSDQKSGDLPGVKLGPGVSAVATIGAEAIHTSNMYLQDQNAESAFGYLVSPGLLIVGQGSQINYEVGAGLEAAKYNVSQGPGSYLDANFKLKSTWEPMTQHHFRGDFTSQFGHDPFGVGRTEGTTPVGATLDKWIDNTGHALYRYGAYDANINLETELGFQVHRYRTNEAITQYLNYRVLSVRESAYYNVSSRTALVAEILHDQASFFEQRPGTFTLDGNETRIRAGIRWLATAHTTGDLRVGEARHNQDASQLQSTHSVDWVATLTWAPLSYSVVSLQSGSQTAQSYLAAVSYIQNRFESLSWTHNWSSDFLTRANLTHLDSKFVGSSRTDHINTIGAEADYRATQHWLGLLGASYSRRSTDEAGLGYRDATVYLGVRYAH